MFARLMRTTDDGVATLLRLVLGVVFFPHGAQKVLGWFGGYGFHATLQGMSKMLPAWLVVIPRGLVQKLAPAGRRLKSDAIAKPPPGRPEPTSRTPSSTASPSPCASAP